MLVKLPGKGKEATAEVGMVTTVWKGVKAPKQCVSPVPINQCFAFRVVILEPANTEQDLFFFWVGRLGWLCHGCHMMIEHEGGSYDLGFLLIHCFILFHFLLDIALAAQDPMVDWVCNAKSCAMVLRLESLITILDVERTAEPLDPLGNFKVVLHPQSANALAKVSAIEEDLWSVGHTMVRGQDKVMACGGTAVDFDGRKKAAPKMEGDATKKKAAKRKSAEGEDETDPPLSEDDFRRNAMGRAAIQKMMVQIHDSEALHFQAHPTFDATTGCCTIKADGANQWCWNDVLDAAPATIECLCLDWFETF